MNSRTILGNNCTQIHVITYTNYMYVQYLGTLGDSGYHSGCYPHDSVSGEGNTC